MSLRTLAESNRAAASHQAAHVPRNPAPQPGRGGLGGTGVDASLAGDSLRAEQIFGQPPPDEGLDQRRATPANARHDP